MYALIAVPLIEPSIDLRRTVTTTEQDRQAARQRPATVHEELRAWFTERDWELTSTLLFEVGQGILLCKEYDNGRDGTLKFKPCTVVLLGDKTNKSIEQWRREAVILQAEEAHLKFDGPLSLAAASRGNLEGGHLLGRFTVRSDQREPGPSDDLFIMSQDAELADNRIVTRHPIQFRLGKSYGSGRDVRIDLVPDNNGAFSGISRLQINHDVVMHIDVASMQRPGDGQAQGEGASARHDTLGGSMGADGKSQPPLQIKSQGPFEFDLVQYVARFRDQVDVLRLHPQGQSDSLKGDLLSLYFTPVGVANDTGKFAKLEPDRIEVRGVPVVMDSPMRQLRAQGEHLIYQFGIERITLEGKRPVVVEREGSRIEAPKLIYEVPPKSARTRFGRFSATGPGKLRAFSPNRPDMVYQARWTRQALFGPDQEHHIVSLLGDAMFEEPQSGSIAGEEIYVWLMEQPEGARTPLLPERMLAQGRVVLDSPQLACNVEMLQAWFITDALRIDPRIEELPPPNRVSVRASSGELRSVQLVSHPQASSGQFVAPATHAAPPEVGNQPSAAPPGVRSLPPVNPPRETPKSKYSVRGKLLQAELKLVPGRGDQIEAKPSQLRVRENVRVTETLLTATGEAPLVLMGDQVDYKQTSDIDGLLHVTGDPAHVEGRGATLEGAVIRLNRGTSELDVEGSGTMALPANQDLQGNAIAEAKPLRISWLKNLHFDGRTAHFEDRVLAEFDGQTLRAQSMDVAFAHPINFASPSQQPAEVLELICNGRVTIEGSTLDPSGQLASIDRMESGELRVHRPSGAVLAHGPGSMVSVRRGAMTLTGAESMQAPRAANHAETSLTYVRVDFTTRGEGNLNARTMTFGNSVKTIFGPVATWDQKITLDDLDRLGPDRRPLVQQSGYMQSEQLTVSQMRTADGATSLEIDASGNASFEGFNFQNESFIARGNHIKYAQEKELVILEGDGRNDAELVRSVRVGVPGQRATSRKIDFWLGNNSRPPRVLVDGARHMDLAIPANTAPRPRSGIAPFVGAANVGQPASERTPMSTGPQYADESAHLNNSPGAAYSGMYRDR